MSLTDFTSYDSIRAVIGVSNEELEDSTLALDLYSDYLLAELEEISSDLADDYLDILAIDEADRTSPQSKFFKTTQLFSAYAVAKQLGTSLPLMALQGQTDSKATGDRFTDNPYQETMKRIEAEYSRFKAKLSDAYGSLTSAPATTRTTLNFFAATGLAVDPVTGS